jgi:transcriptional regulator with GAF, ATPase, and Fis domain
MDPIPETLKAIDEFGPFLDDDDLLKHLLEMGRRVREVVPECVGLSMSFRDHGVTFTLVASDESIAALDGLQYLDGGPCVAAVEEERVVRFPDEDALGEDEWQLFARGTAAASVASTLTLPLVVGDRVTGSVNLYAASPNAFADKEQEIAAIVGGVGAGRHGERRPLVLHAPCCPGGAAAPVRGDADPDRRRHPGRQLGSLGRQRTQAAA